MNLQGDGRSAALPAGRSRGPAARASNGVSDAGTAVRGWLSLQRARVAHIRHPELGEVSAYCFYATKLRFRDLAFDIGANHGEHTARMLNRGARVVSVEPQPQLAAALVNRFPSAIVLPLAVSDQRGNAVLHMAGETDQIASLDASWTEALPASWTDTLPRPVTWTDRIQVQVVTVDELIGEYGEPRVLKIDTEGFDHRVLRSLSRPVQHVLFETNPARTEAAAECFAHLEELGRYEYFWAPHSSGTSTWLFRKAQPPAQILATLVTVGDVYARRIG